ncbi:MAG: class I SAM-dependent methyltransferase [Alphaproteobacteria bacterium]|nr:class I SAM-dependent methyltransferase [Alphaproteobacteria bacterium]
MDQMYRAQRHIYDFTRKYYLFGRDSLIRDLPVKAGESLCEVGCGTARNLIILARRHPQAQFFGIDASAEMLKTAGENVARAHVPVQLKTALADSYSWNETFGLEKPFDRLLFSYSLSMIDDWRGAILHGLRQVRKGGTIHIVDFGNQEGLPPWFKRALGAWLDKFHVRFRPEIKPFFEDLQRKGVGRMAYRDHMRGYAYLLSFEVHQPDAASSL